jgi:hypothetical protein
MIQSEGVSWKALCGPLWVGSRERRKQPAKLGSVGRKLVRDFRGKSRKDPMLAFAPATATLLLDYEDGFVVVE